MQVSDKELTIKRLEDLIDNQRQELEQKNDELYAVRLGELRSERGHQMKASLDLAMNSTFNCQSPEKINGS